MANEQEVYRRIVSRRILLQNNGLWLVFHSVMAAFSLVFTLICLYLLMDLLVSQGALQVSSQERHQLQSLVTAVDGRGNADNTGLRSYLWRHRDCPLLSRLVSPLSRFIPFRTNRGTLASLVLLVVVLSMLRSLGLQRARSRAIAISQETSNTLRSQIHRQILRLGPGDLDHREYSTAQNLFVETVESISQSLTNLLSLGVYQWCSIFLVVSVMLVLDWSITVQSLVPLLGGGALILWEREQGGDRRVLDESRADTDLRVLSEGLRKSRIIRGFGMEGFEQERFQKHLERYSKWIRSAASAEVWSLTAARVIGALLLGIVVFLIGSRVLGAGKPLGLPEASTILGGCLCLAPLVKGLLRRRALRPQVIVQAAAVQRFLAILPDVGQAVGAKFIEPVRSTIQFEGVSYRKEGQTILTDFELRIPAGTITALISLDPLEARAAAAMLPRFIEPSAGRVLFDGEDIAWGTLESIRAETIYVGGDDPCFTGSVSENIRCGDSRFESPTIMDAAKLVHAHHFIQRLPQGYETQLGEHGEQLTVGQTFLLGLARAVIRNPAVIIIEEPTDVLDQTIKDYLDDAYPRLAAERTIILVPARLSTVRRCDRVVMIDGGRVASVGTQAELVKTSECYRHWEYVTFNTFRRPHQSQVAARNKE